MKDILSNDRKICLYLALELFSEGLCIENYRIVIGKFMKAVCTADLIVVIAQNKDYLEVSVVKAHTYIHECIDSIERVLENVIQIQ